MADLTGLIQQSLDLKCIEDLGEVEGGWICNSKRYQTENGKLFVKTYEQDKVHKK